MLIWKCQQLFWGAILCGTFYTSTLNFFTYKKEGATFKINMTSDIKIICLSTRLQLPLLMQYPLLFATLNCGVGHGYPQFRSVQWPVSSPKLIAVHVARPAQFAWHCSRVIPLKINIVDLTKPNYPTFSTL